MYVCVVCFVIEFCGCPKVFEIKKKRKKRNRLINDDLTINSLTNDQMEGKQLTLDRDWITHFQFYIDQTMKSEMDIGTDVIAQTEWL